MLLGELIDALEKIRTAEDSAVEVRVEIEDEPWGARIVKVTYNKVGDTVTLEAEYG